METSAAPEASADPEASVAPEANTVLEMNIAPEANTMSTPGDSSATEGCLHQNFVQASTGHWGSQYSDPDAEGHTISTYIVKGYVCQDCGYQWEDEMPEEPSVYREPHSFQNGTCSYCGYKNQCAHANQEIQESREELEYINPTAEGHTVSYYARINRSCLDCGEFFRGARPEEKTTVQETHFYGVDSVCTRCGYECPHLNLYVNDGQLDMKFEKIDDYMHLRSYTPGKTYHCNDCYKSWSEPTGELVSRKEAHDWVYDGTCNSCGAVNVCTHPNKSLMDEYVSTEDDQYVDNGDSGHIIQTGATVQEWFCYDCNQGFEIEIEPVTGVQEPHDYEGGECWKCGHINPCAHKNSYVNSVSAEGGVGRSEGESGHTQVNATVVTERICNDCGDWFTVEEEGDFFEPHVFYEDNICAVCGYENACAHPNAEQYEYYIVTDADSYKNAGTEGHYALCIRETRYDCPDCGAYWRETEETAVRRLIPPCVQSVKTLLIRCDQQNIILCHNIR